MKKQILMGAAVLLALCVKAQEVSTLDKDITEKEVPAACLKTFNTKYPKQKVDKWELKGGNYEADFTMNGKFCEFSMKKDGSWIESEKAIEKSDVPKVIMEELAKNKEWKDWTFDHAEEVETPKHKQLFEVTVKKGTSLAGLYYTPDGKTIVRVEKE